MGFEDDRWALEQQARRLDEVRRELAALRWDPLPGELARRFLDAHARHDEALRAALADLAATLSAVEEARIRAGEQTREADRQAGRVRVALDEAQADTSTAWRSRDLQAEYEWRTRDALPAVWESLERANRAGQGEAEA